MKFVDIAIKDMRRYFRSAFAVGMMLVIPLLITGLIYAAFGGVLVSSETEEYTLPEIRIQIVNLDQGDPNSDLNLGQYLIDALTDESVQNVFDVVLSEDEAAARASVDAQEAALAVIIPAHFTEAAVEGRRTAEVELYQDPALSFGPGITKEIVEQFLDALTGGQIAGAVTADLFTSRGLAVDLNARAEVQSAYNAWFQSMASEKQWKLPVVKRLPNRETPKSIADHRTTLLGPVMAGMMIFFVFFTGANTAQLILKEQEEGTLARIFATPTRLSVILGGKFTAVFFTLIVQAIVLAAASALAFQINWGNLAALGMVMFGLVTAGTGFGILLISFIKNNRQAGAVIGGVLAVTGMLSGLFTTGFSGSSIFDQLGLFFPQGWALHGMKLVLAGAAPQDVLITLAALLGFGLTFFAAGIWKFRSRFA